MTTPINTFRSICPISRSLDLLGDKWTLLIIRDMIFFHKKTFKEFIASQEKIATNILSNRLARLETMEVICKSKLKTNRRVNIYTLTDKGLQLLPVLLELSLWFTRYSPLDKELEQIQKLFTQYKQDREGFVKGFIETYRMSI